MNTVHELRHIDLNLLVALDALLDERQVTRAAGRVGVTQSAMSHTLLDSEISSGDPLLVRSGRGMTLTPRAESLRVPVRSGLVTLGRALTTPDTFDPATATVSFRLATPDLFDSLALPPLLAVLRAAAPGTDLALLPADVRTLPARLETGEITAAVIAVPATRDANVVPTLATTPVCASEPSFATASAASCVPTTQRSPRTARGSRSTPSPPPHTSWCRREAAGRAWSTCIWPRLAAPAASLSAFLTS